MEQAYGLDQDLVNGVQYHNRYMSCQGHPYFMEDRFASGSVSVRGRIYKDVRLRYDLYSQHVEIEYENFSGGSNVLITITDNVDAFSRGAFEFLKLNLGQEPTRFYQVIRTNVFTCYVYREKELIPLTNNMLFIEQFIKASLTYQMEMDGRLYEFNNMKSFAALFPEDQQKMIKRYLRRKHFTFRKATPGAIVRNMSAVSNLSASGGLP
ncbi:MAG: hypothetical protein KAR19_01785 [Bacteroidales bacterium]|nr:hypothetical protein [Bacteroidales bacterium]